MSPVAPADRVTVVLLHRVAEDVEHGRLELPAGPVTFKTLPGADAYLTAALDAVGVDQADQATVDAAVAGFDACVEFTVRGARR